MSERWYIYRNRLTNKEIKVEDRLLLHWLRGYELIKVIDLGVEKKKK